MKVIIISSIIFVLGACCYGQMTRIYSTEGKVEYALIDNGNLHSSIRPDYHGYSAIVYRQNINRPSIPIKHFCSGPSNDKMPFSWSKSQEILFSVAFWRSNAARIATIYYREFEQRDTVEISSSVNQNKIIFENELVLTPLSNYFNSFSQLKQKLNREEMIAIENTLSFDIYPQNKKLEFYLRDKDAFYLWECDVPEQGIVANWREVVVYAMKDWDSEYVPRKYSDSYTGKKTKLASIPDSLFMDGHFKVVVQGKNKFIINREHALIYYINGNEIVRVGSVYVSKDYPAIRGKKLFIEDRDNDEIIFFAPVTWETNNYPKPKVKVMTKKEMKDKFKYVLK